MFKAFIANPFFLKAINIFEHMEIEEYIYEGVVELSYKTLPRKTPNVLVTSGIR